MLTEREIYDTVMECANQHTGGKNASIARYFEVDYPQRLSNLQKFINDIVLRDIGDYREFIRLTDAMNALEGRQPSSEDRALLAMMCWMHDVIGEIKPNMGKKPRLVISLLVYGEEYAHKLNKYLFASWNTQGNMDALLDKFDVYISLCTTYKTPRINAFEKAGVEYLTTYIPDELVQNMQGENKWRLLGTAGSIALAHAKALGASFHQAFPDMIYSGKYWSEIIRLSEKHESILMPAHRCDESVISKYLPLYETEESGLDISSSDLCAVGLNAQHVCDWSNMLNNRPNPVAIPVSHRLHWETADNLLLYTPHLNASYLGAATVAKISDRFYHTLDSELDMVCREWYIPQDDDIYAVEVSNQSVHAHDDRYMMNSEYPKVLWQVIGMKDSFKFFRKGMSVKLNRNLRPKGEKVFSLERARMEMEQIHHLCEAMNPYAQMVLRRVV